MFAGNFRIETLFITWVLKVSTTNQTAQGESLVCFLCLMAYQLS